LLALLVFDEMATVQEWYCTTVALFYSLFIGVFAVAQWSEWLKLLLL